MKSATLLLLALLVVQAPTEVPVAQEPSHHLVLENQYTRVYQVEVLPGKATLLHRHEKDYVFVVLGDAHISNEVAGQPARDMQVKDGDVNFAKGGFAHVARNIGETPFRNVTIEVLRKSKNIDLGGGAGVVTDAVEATLHVMAAAPDAWNRLDDRGHLLVAVSDLRLRSEVTGKPVSVVEQKSGDVLWIQPGTQPRLTNLAKAPARFVTIQFH